MVVDIHRLVTYKNSVSFVDNSSARKGRADMNFIFNRPSFAHGGAALLAALTLGLACLFCGFNAGADNDDEYKECAEQSGQEDACAALNIIRELRHSVELMREASASAAGIMRRPDQNIAVQPKAGASAADIMRRPDQNIVVQ